MTLALQHGGLWVGNGVNFHNTKAARRNDVNYLGAHAGVMGQTPADAGAHEMSEGDLESARLLGERVASLAAKFKG